VADVPAGHRTVLVTGHSFLQDTGQYTVLVTGDTTSCRTQDNTLYYELEAHFPAGHRTILRTGDTFSCRTQDNTKNLTFSWRTQCHDNNRNW